jgi:cation diffusion facilitator family transporter
MPEPEPPQQRTQRLALVGLLCNLGLAGVKLVAGIAGSSYALVADAVESLSDILGSVVVWGGLHISAKPISEKHPYGYGKAESLAALAVACLLVGAGVWIGVEAVQEIITPHTTPAWWTLVVLASVVIVKEALARRMAGVAAQTGSDAAEADAWHHRSDAITSASAFIGILIAVLAKWRTGTDAWAAADDWAALLAAGVIVAGAVRLMRVPLRELLDVQAIDVVARAGEVASRVPGVARVQKAFARKSGTRYWIDMHVWVDGSMSVRDSHRVAHAVKDAVRQEIPGVHDVLIHVEPAAEEVNHPR